MAIPNEAIPVDWHWSEHLDEIIHAWALGHQRVTNLIAAGPHPERDYVNLTTEQLIERVRAVIVQHDENGLHKDKVTLYNDNVDKLVDLQDKIRKADGSALKQLQRKYMSLEKETHSSFVKPILDAAGKVQKDKKLAADRNEFYYNKMKEEIKQITA